MPAPIYLRARAGPQADQAAQAQEGFVAAPRLQDAGLAPVQRHEDRAHRRGRRLDPAPRHGEAQGNRGVHHRERDQGRAAEGTARREDALSRQSHGPVRHRRAGRRLGPHGPQDHRRYLRRHGPSRRRRVLGQGPEQGGPQRGLHGPVRGEEHRRGGPGGSRAKSSSPTPSVIPSRSRCTSTRSAPARSTTTRSPTR